MPREVWPLITRHIKMPEAMAYLCRVLIKSQALGEGHRAFPVWEPFAMTLDMRHIEQRSTLR